MDRQERRHDWTGRACLKNMLYLDSHCLTCTHTDTPASVLLFHHLMMAAVMTGVISLHGWDGRVLRWDRDRDRDGTFYGRAGRLPSPCHHSPAGGLAPIHVSLPTHVSENPHPPHRQVPHLPHTSRQGKTNYLPTPLHCVPHVSSASATILHVSLYNVLLPYLVHAMAVAVACGMAGGSGWPACVPLSVCVVVMVTVTGEWVPLHCMWQPADLSLVCGVRNRQ